METQSRTGAAVATAMICSAALTAQLIGGKAARDALYLAHLSVTSLPTMVIVSSLVSIVLVIASSRAITRFTPTTFVPVAFIASAILFLAEWLATSLAPTPAAIVVYLHMTGIGPVLASGFWLIATESFDPRTAKKRFGHIAGAGTLGGILGGLIAERLGMLLGVASVLPFLAALNIVGAWSVYKLTRGITVHGAPSTNMPSRSIEGADSMQSALRVLKQAPYIRQLAALVLLGTMSAAFIDYIFKFQAVQTFGRGEYLLRFFAVYYTATSVITFIVQSSLGGFLLQRFGLALATSLPSVSVFAGGLLSLIVPQFGSVVGVRGGETVFRGSLFRYGYELFYTPLPPAEKRSVKSIVDIGFDRLGDTAGALIIRMVLAAAAPAAQYSVLLFLAVVSSAVAILLASQLNRAYIHTLEKSLLNQAIDLDLSDVVDGTTRTLVLKTMAERATLAQKPGFAATGPAAPPDTSHASVVDDPLVRDIIWLRSRDRDQVLQVLRREDPLPASLVAHVIPLLAWAPVASDAITALRRIAPQHVGELSDALVDPNQDFAIRRRVARVFSATSSQRAVDTLLVGLEDLRFEVRFQCGRSLSAIFEQNAGLTIDRHRVLDVVLREVTVGRPVWESRRLLDGLEPSDNTSFVDEFVRDRAGQSLAHVFTLLSLVLPKEPLQIAFRGLHTADQNLRGTALEYLEGVLPPQIRERLWPYLEDPRPANRPVRAREEILADLLHSNESIMVNLAELKRRYSGA